jgi:hypothetical protein
MRQLAARLSDTSAAILRALQDSQEKWNIMLMLSCDASGRDRLN